MRTSSLSRSAAFSTEEEALAAIREELARNGPAIVLRSVLVRADSRGNRTEIAEGQALVDRARAVTTHRNGRAPRARSSAIPA